MNQATVLPDEHKTLEQIESEIADISRVLYNHGGVRQPHVVLAEVNESNVRRLVELYDLRRTKCTQREADRMIRCRVDLVNLLDSARWVHECKSISDNAIEVRRDDGWCFTITLEPAVF